MSALTVLGWVSTVGIGCCLVLTLLTTLFFTISIARFYKSMVRGPRLKSFGLAVNVLSTLLFTATTIAIFTACVLLMCGESESLAQTLAISVYLLSHTTMICALAIRVDVTFRHSALANSQQISRMLYALSTCSVAVYVLMACSFALNLMLMTCIFAVLWCLLYLVLCIILGHLFVHKMGRLMAKQLENNAASPTSPSLSAVTEMIDSELLHLVTKHALLVSIVIASSFVFPMIAVVLSFVANRAQDTFQPVAVFWIVVDCAVNVLCICLLFGFSKSVYSVLCAAWHAKCERCKSSQMKRRKRKRDNNVSPPPTMEREKSISLVDCDANPIPSNPTHCDINI